jgi:hypothetical protein
MKTALQQAAFVLAFGIAGAARAEVVYLVEISDHQKKPSYEIMSSTDLRALKKTVEEEARVFPKALELVKKEWNESDKAAAKDLKPAERGVLMPFPNGRLAPRKVEEKGNFADPKMAEKKKETLQNRAFESSFGKDPKKTGRQLTDQEKQRIAKEREKDLAADRAAGLLEQKIQDLLKNPAGGAPAGDKPAGNENAGDKPKAADAQPK